MMPVNPDSPAIPTGPTPVLGVAPGLSAYTGLVPMLTGHTGNVPAASAGEGEPGNETRKVPMKKPSKPANPAKGRQEMQQSVPVPMPVPGHTPDLWRRRPIALSTDPKESAELFAALSKQDWCAPFRGLGGTPPRQQLDVCIPGNSVPLKRCDLTNNKAIYQLTTFLDLVLEALIWLHERQLTAGNMTADNLLISFDGGVLITTAGEPEAWPPLPSHERIQRDLQRLGKAVRSVLVADVNGPSVQLQRPDLAPNITQFVDWIGGLGGMPPAQDLGAARMALTSVRTGSRCRLPWQREAEGLDRLVVPEEAPVFVQRKRFKAKKTRRWVLPVAIASSIVLLLSVVVYIFMTMEKVKPKPREIAPLEVVVKEPPLPSTPASRAARAAAAMSPVSQSAPLLPRTERFDPPALPSAEVVRRVADAAPVRPLSVQESQVWRRAFSDQDRRPIEMHRLGLTSTGGSTANIFPAVGRSLLVEAAPGFAWEFPESARGPGDYFVTIFTRDVVITEPEVVRLQRSLLGWASFCGVQVLSWTVLPHATGMVVRVPAKGLLSIEEVASNLSKLKPETGAQEIYRKAIAARDANNMDEFLRILLPLQARTGSLQGFLEQLQNTPLLPEVKNPRELWMDIPHRLSKLSTLSEIQTAAINIERAAVVAEFVTRPMQWMPSSYGVSSRGYLPGLEGLIVVMDAESDYRSARGSSTDELLIQVLRSYGILIGDLPRTTPLTTVNGRLPGLPQTPVKARPTTPAEIRHEPPARLSPQIRSNSARTSGAGKNRG